jgi:tetratricopeptide (TPR) repeat protein
LRAWAAALLFVLLPAPASAYLLCDDAAKLKEFNQAIRTWNGSLSDKRYAELDRHFSALHAAHESGKLTDAEVMRWYRLFESANAGNEPLHLEWIAAYPRSQAAYIALAVHMVERGFAARGRDFADKTSPLQFKGMADAFAKAIAALDKADTLSRKPTLSLAIRIRIAAAAGSKPDERQLYRTAITKYPDTLIARIRFIRVSHPKWGGSIEQLTGIATDAKSLPEADRRYVEYLVFQEIGSVLVDQRDWRRAAEVYEKSVPLCPGFDDGLDNAIAAIPTMRGPTRRARSRATRRGTWRSPMPTTRRRSTSASRRR